MTKFDYDLQVWVIKGKVKNCEHPSTMSDTGKPCCNQRRYNGLSVALAKELESMRTAEVAK